MTKQEADVYLYQSCLFIAAFCQFVTYFEPLTVSAAECQIRNGARRNLFRGLQAKLLDTHRASGKPAMYEHKCQYCCKFRCGQVKTRASWTYFATRAFQSYKNSCHGFSQFVWPGVPTLDRSNRKKWTSTITRFFLWPVARHATGVTILSKNCKRFTQDTALLQRMFLSPKHALDAARQWYSRSSLGLLLLFPGKMYPNHLWHPSRSTTATLSPPGVVIVFGGWVCVVSKFVLS